MFADAHSQEKFWKETGYKLDQYKANYDRLRTIPASEPHDADILNEDYHEMTGGYGGTTRGLVPSANMRYLVMLYLQSNPGIHTTEHRELINFIRSFYDGGMSIEKKVRLPRLLISRLELNRQATECARGTGAVETSRH